MERPWREYRTATEHVLAIMGGEGTSAHALPKIVAEDSKAGKAIIRIQEIYRGEGQSSTLTPGNPSMK